MVKRLTIVPKKEHMSNLQMWQHCYLNAQLPLPIVVVAKYRIEILVPPKSESKSPKS